MVYYLDPEFDPKKLTKAEIRSIMGSHGILDLPPPSAKKDELLDMFYKEIIAKRKSIIEAQKSIKAKSDGIVFLDESSRPSPKKPKSSKAKFSQPTSDFERSPSPIKSDIDFITRPETPLAVSTYKLVSRLENLQSKNISKRKLPLESKDYRFVPIVIAFSFSSLVLIFLYFKLWFVWPMYTDEQLLKLEQKPILFVKCPYNTSSLIGSCINGKLYCASGYIEKKNWVGFGASCVIDKERLSLIQSIKKKIVFELQTRLGMSQCYKEHSPDISKSDLYGLTFNYFKNMKVKTFADYFDICLRSLLQEGMKIESRSSGEDFLFKAKEPIHTYYCRAKISIRNVLEQRPIEVISGIFFALITTILLLQLQSKHRQKRLINHYYLLICKILKEQSAQHRNDPTISSFISTNQLRDAVLIKCAPREKSMVWPKIISEVSKNSNIVESITIFRGEQTRVWEWIGADVSI